MAKTIEPDFKSLSFEERAAKYQDEIKPICEKYGVAPWAGLQSTNEVIAAVPQIKDLWKKDEEEAA